MSSAAPAFPKHPPLRGQDLVLFRPSERARWQPGYVLSPPGAPEEQEIAGDVDVVDVRPVRSTRVYQVPRQKLKKLSGAALVKLQEELAQPARRSSLGRGKRPAPAPAEDAPCVLSIAGPAVLRAIPKPAAPPRSEAYKAWIRTLACIACEAQRTPTEAHHHGRRAVGRKCSDYRCVPLCSACHHAITSTHRLPGRTRRETEALIRDVLLDLHDLYLAGEGAAGRPLSDGRFLRPAPAALPALQPLPPPDYTTEDVAFLAILDGLHSALVGVPHAVA